MPNTFLPSSQVALTLRFFSLRAAKFIVIVALLFMVYGLSAQIGCSRKEFKEYNFSVLCPYDSKEVKPDKPNLIYSCYVPMAHDPAAKQFAFNVFIYGKSPTETQQQFLEQLQKALPAGASFSGSFAERKPTDYNQDYRTVTFTYKETVTHMFVYFRRDDVVMLEYRYGKHRASELNEVASTAGKRFFWEAQYIDIPQSGLNVILPYNLEGVYDLEQKKVVYTVADDELAKETEGRITLELQGAPTTLDTAKVRKAIMQELAAKPSLRLVSKEFTETYGGDNRLDKYTLQQTEGSQVYDLLIYQVYMGKQLVRLTCRSRSGTSSKLQRNCMSIASSVKPLKG